MTYHRISWTRRVLTVLAVMCALGGVSVAWAGQGALVTQIMGGARVAGESVGTLDAIPPDQSLVTGESEAAGLLVGDVVIHVSGNSQVQVNEDVRTVLIRLDRGYIVVTVAPDSKREVKIETPFGFLKSTLTDRSAGAGCRYAVRHDPPRQNSPETSTYSTIEAGAMARGTNPVTDPRILRPGEQWPLIAGQPAGDPQTVDARSAADALRASLNRSVVETPASRVVDSLLALDEPLVPAGFDTLGTVTKAELLGQEVVDVNTAVLETEPELELEELELEVVERIRAPRVIPAGNTVNAVAQFVSYDGPPTNPDWNDFLASTNGQPSFQPEYVASFANGGFSYLQFVGTGAVTALSDAGETFFVGDGEESAGWAVFTPRTAVHDAGFELNSPLVNVVGDGFRAIARGDHLTGGGAIGGTGANSDSAFAGVVGGQIRLDTSPPIGFPSLEAAASTVGLTVGGQPLSDQIAALGTGLNAQDLSQPAERLLFLSNSNRDANGNTINAEGGAIQPTVLNLPDERQADLVRDSELAFSSLGTPLAADGSNTVGIQFVPEGDVLVIIHHTGLRAGVAGSTVLTDNFAIERADRTTTIRWRGGARPVGANGQQLEFVDLNANTAVRNELFLTICDEVNGLVPVNTQTICGPPTTTPQVNLAALTARRALDPKRETTRVRPVVRRKVDTRRSLVREVQLTKGRAPTSATGRLGRAVRSPSIRRAPMRTPAPR